MTKKIDPKNPQAKAAKSDNEVGKATERKTASFKVGHRKVARNTAVVKGHG